MRDTRSHMKLCYVRRNFIGYTQPLDRTYMRAFKSSIRHEVAKHFAEFFLEAESNFERVDLESFRFSGSCCSRSCTQQHRTQTARNIELLAGASSIGTRWSSVSFSQKQKTSSGDWGTVSTRHSRGASDAEAEATDSDPEAHVTEPLA